MVEPERRGDRTPGTESLISKRFALSSESVLQGKSDSSNATNTSNSTATNTSTARLNVNSAPRGPPVAGQESQPEMVPVLGSKHPQYRTLPATNKTTASPVKKKRFGWFRRKNKTKRSDIKSRTTFTTLHKHCMTPSYQFFHLVAKINVVVTGQLLFFCDF
ncbi:unnamed protein product [Bursaphelenchus okinawaensis]|uniref:Uncharacterized protein n=1 Tax=Bursaphelenchus okinawaensis TaxID=465554 RepID=A0A811LRK6_9BILA|nr:unnamed protein product [Bursaphelenchus okinawaensis]CAG9127881.1 unnamed protein product [Bursaphelenchus okinawaensis]